MSKRYTSIDQKVKKNLRKVEITSKKQTMSQTNGYCVLFEIHFKNEYLCKFTHNAWDECHIVTTAQVSLLPYRRLFWIHKLPAVIHNFVFQNKALGTKITHRNNDNYTFPRAARIKIKLKFRINTIIAPTTTVRILPAATSPSCIQSRGLIENRKDDDAKYKRVSDAKPRSPRKLSIIPYRGSREPRELPHRYTYITSSHERTHIHPVMAIILSRDISVLEMIFRAATFITHTQRAGGRWQADPDTRAQQYNIVLRHAHAENLANSSGVENRGAHITQKTRFVHAYMYTRLWIRLTGPR